MSPLRCEYRPPCPGCPRFADEGLPSSVLERLESWASRHGPVVVEQVPWSGPQYRHRVRLSVRRRDGRLRLGLFEAGSHRLVPIERCLLHHPALVQATELVREIASRHAVEPYDEVNHRGLLRAVQIAVERKSERVQIVLVLRDSLTTGVPSGLTEFLEELGQASLIQGLFLNGQPEPTNTLLGSRMLHVCGEPVLRDELGGASQFYPPGAFGQANLPLHAQAVAQIHEWVPARARVVEFHAGVGTIGLGLITREVGPVSRMTFNELGAGSLEGLELGIAALGFRETVVSVRSGPASAHLDCVGQADVVIVDPPRKGLEPELLAAFRAAEIPRIIYLSCGLDSLLRDGAALVGAGYRLRVVRAYAYFPFTDHIETLVLFENAGAASSAPAEEASLRPRLP